MKTNLTKLFVDFFDSEKASGIALILCTIASIAVANSIFGKDYSNFWQTQVGTNIGSVALKHSLEYWINDGLMAVFFLLIGLEIERELYAGELSDMKNAALPMFAALGGMLTPACFHFLLNHGTETQAGAGIPMATDIAFALGMLAILGRRVPASLKVFLVALAIIDDLGAIVVIALFYSSDVSLIFLGVAIAIFGVLLIFNRVGVVWLPAYLIPGLVMWYFMLESGIHATIAGVLLAFAIPFGRGDGQSPSYKLQHFLHRPVAFIIMPIFALANTGIAFSVDWMRGLTTSNSLGIMAGLILGKPLGISLFSFVAVKVRVAQLPNSLSWRHIVGAGFLGGIGFTMSIFITLLAFDSPATVVNSKISILLGSIAAASAGLLILSRPGTTAPGRNRLGAAASALPSADVEP